MIHPFKVIYRPKAEAEGVKVLPRPVARRCRGRRLAACVALEKVDKTEDYSHGN